MLVGESSSISYGERLVLVWKRSVSVSVSLSVLLDINLNLGSPSFLSIGTLSKATFSYAHTGLLFLSDKKLLEASFCFCQFLAWS